MICPKCSKKIEDDSLFCSVCGINLKEEIKGKFVNNSSGDNAGKNNTSKQFKSLLVIISIIGCVLFFVSAQQINKAADDMITLHSQSGTSLAEAYYQDVGNALKGFAMFARALGVSVVTITMMVVFNKR